MRRATFALIVSLAAASGARAQTLEDRLRTQLVAVTTQLRDAQAGQTAAVADKAAAEKARDDLKAALAKAQAQLKAAKRAARPAVPPAESAAAQAKARQADAEQASQLAAARADAQRLTGQLAQMQSERDRAAAGAGKATTSLQVCVTKNAALIAVAKDILHAYDRVSFAGVIARKEPFLGLKRVQIEQIEQDYGDRIYAGRLDVTPKALPVAPAPVVGGAPK